MVELDSILLHTIYKCFINAFVNNDSRNYFIHQLLMFHKRNYLVDQHNNKHLKWLCILQLHFSEIQS